MLSQMVALGLRSWHAFWTPVKLWADYHQDHNGDALVFFASLATIIGLPLLALLVVATLGFLIVDRTHARRERAHQRRVILLGLAAELRGMRDTASEEIMTPASRDGGAWTILPHTGVEKALGDAGLLALTSEEIVALHELRLRILKVNGLIRARHAIPPASGARSEAFGPAGDRLGGRIRDQFEAISGLCDDLLARLYPPRPSDSTAALTDPRRPTEQRPFRQSDG